MAIDCGWDGGPAVGRSRSYQDLEGRTDGRLGAGKPSRHLEQISGRPARPHPSPEGFLAVRCRARPEAKSVEMDRSALYSPIGCHVECDLSPPTRNVPGVETVPVDRRMPMWVPCPAGECDVMSRWDEIGEVVAGMPR